MQILAAQDTLEDAERRQALCDRFVFSQKNGQEDPWAERAHGRDAHEFTPIARITMREAAE